MIKAVIFDLDGTLLNTLGDLTAAVNHGLTVCGLPTHTEAQVRTYIGDGVTELIKRACPPDADEATLAAVLAEYLPYYAAHNMDFTRPYDGVMEVLAELRRRGIKTAVVSNKHDSGVQALCTHYFDGLLDTAVGGGDARPLKPAPDGVLYAMELLGVIPDEVWYVGDSTIDVVTARNAGVPCVAVSWGFHDRPRLVAEHPAVLADTADQLLAALCKS